MKRMSRVLSVFLAVLMCFSCIPFASSATDANSNVRTEENTDVQYNATNALGEVITDAMEADAQGESEYGIYTVEIDGTTADVTLSSPDDSTLVVSVYDEDSSEMISVGNIAVDSETEEVELELSEYDLPDYYIIRAFLLNSEKEAVCKKYENLDHTREYEEFLSKTIYDFDDDNIINLDNTYDNNFAVVSEDAVFAKSTSSKNLVMSDDEQTGVCVIENADNKVKNLEVGDTFYMPYGDEGNYILTKVGSIDINNSTVTITPAEEFEISDLFTYIKIDTDKEGIEIQESPNMLSGLFITAFAEGSNEDDYGNDTFTSKPTFTGTIIDYKSGDTKVNLKVTLGLEISLKFRYDYHLFGKDYYEFEETTKATAKLHTEIKVSASIDIMKLAGVQPLYFYFTIVPGIDVDVTFSLQCKIEAAITASGDVTYTFFKGVKRKSIDKTSTELSNKPKTEFEVKVDGEITFKFIPEVDLGFRFIKVFAVGVGISVPITVPLKIGEISTSDDLLESIHSCALCFSGEIKIGLTGELYVKFGFGDVTKLRSIISLQFLSLEASIGKFYISIGSGESAIEFGWGDCPHRKYKTEFIIHDYDGSISTDSYTISVGNETVAKNASGKYIVYLSNGQYIPSLGSSVAIDTERTDTVFTVKDEAKAVNIYLLNEIEQNDKKVNFYIYKSDGTLAPGDYSINIALNGITVGTASKVMSGYYVSFLDEGNYTFDLGMDTDSIVDKNRTSFSFRKANNTAATISIYLKDANDDYQEFPPESGDIVQEGDCGAEGDNVKYTLYANGLLSIYGNGAMADYRVAGDGTESPWNWHSYQDGHIKYVKIGEGITHIGKYAFGANFGDVEFGNKVIPSSVESIGENAFSYCSKISSVLIPNAVTRIEASTFKGCGLKEVTIPENVSYIGWEAFYGCSQLTSITVLGEITEMNTLAFGGGSNICPITDATATMSFLGYDTVNMSLSKNLKNVTILSECAGTPGASGSCFSSKLERVTFTENVKEIGSNAFKGCSGLTQISIPATVQSIESYAFRDCTGLLSVDFQDGINYIGSGAFQGCTGLSTITIPQTVDMLNESLFSGCTGLTEIVLQEGLTKIAKNVFYKCTGIVSISIPLSVVEIGIGAFSGCSSIEEISLPFVGCTVKHKERTLNYPFPYIFGTSSFSGWLKSLNSYTIYYSDSSDSSTISYFYYPSSLKTVVVKGEETIPASVFASCKGIESVVLSSTSKYIGSSAFSGCSDLKDVTLSNSLIEIGNSAFSSCTKLEQVNIPDSVTNIGSGAFSSCQGLHSLFIPDNVQSIGNSAFAGCSSLEEITLPTSLQSLSNSILKNCIGLKNIDIPKAVTSIGESAFYGCEGLEELTIPASVTTMGSYVYPALDNCMNLTYVEFEEGMTTLPAYALIKTPSVRTISIPSTVSAIQVSSLGGLSGLEQIIVDDNNATYTSINNCLVEIVNKQIVLGCKNSIIPDDGSVTGIGKSAFSGCATLMGITIPNSISFIGSGAFSNCDGLTEITIPKSITSVGSDGIISGCDNLKKVIFADGTLNVPTFILKWATSVTEVIIPSSVTQIGIESFEGCTSLVNIDIPSTVNSIGSYAFSGCTNLTNVTIPEALTNIPEGFVSGCSSLVELFIPNSVTSINSRAFKNCPAIESVVVGDRNNKYYSSGNCIIEKNTKKIVFGCKNSIIPVDGAISAVGDYAFSGCSELTGLLLPAGIETIGMGAFGDCSGLTSITLPAGVTTVNSGAFSGCSNLSSIAIPNSLVRIGYRAFENCYKLSNVYYAGTEEEWNEISIDQLNSRLTSATIHYNSTGPQDNSSQMSVSAAPVLASLASIFFPVASAVETKVDSTATTVHCAILGSEYVILAVKDKDAEDFFSSSNLIYIDQQTAETKTITFDVPASVQTAESIFITGSVAHNYAESVITPATCTTDGQKQLVCTECGEISGDTEIIPATGHKYGTWTIVREANCVEKGIEQRVCENDSAHIETREIANTAHIDTDANGICDECGVDMNVEPVGQESNCVCGKYHTGPFAWLVKFFHKIVYFFKNLFHKN